MSARKKPRLVPNPLRAQDADVRRPGDFCDSGSVPVIDAIGDVLVAPTILRQAREDFAAWLASQQVRR